MRAAYNTAWKAANANNDEDEKAFTKGKHMSCVLEGTPPASCEVGDIPKVTDIQLADGVPAHHCASFGAPKTKNTQCAKLRDQKIQYLDRQAACSSSYPQRASHDLPWQCACRDPIAMPAMR